MAGSSYVVSGLPLAEIVDFGGATRKVQRAVKER
jgi:hypothetical protein